MDQPILLSKDWCNFSPRQFCLLAARLRLGWGSCELNWLRKTNFKSAAQSIKIHRPSAQLFNSADPYFWRRPGRVCLSSRACCWSYVFVTDPIRGFRGTKLLFNNRGTGHLQVTSAGRTKLPLTVRWEDLMNCVSQSLSSNEKNGRLMYLNCTVYSIHIYSRFPPKVEVQIQSIVEWHVMTMTLARGCDNYPAVLITGPGPCGQTLNYRHQDQVITAGRDLWLLPWPGPDHASQSPVPGLNEGAGQEVLWKRHNIQILQLSWVLKRFRWQKICFHPTHLLLWTLNRMKSLVRHFTARVINVLVVSVLTGCEYPNISIRALAYTDKYIREGPGHSWRYIHTVRTTDTGHARIRSSVNILIWVPGICFLPHKYLPSLW